jgi:hypothetical protein
METLGTSRLIESEQNLNSRIALSTKFAVSIALLILSFLLAPRDARAAGDENRLSVFADCHCTDPVGLDFCTDFKTKVKDSASYRLVDRPDALGIGVHFWCLDLWNGLPGIDKTLTGTMSAVSVAFTIYAPDQLPGEVYEDSSVFRVGKDAADEMSGRILVAVGQLATANKSAFDKIRNPPKAAAPAPAPTATPLVIQ